jgi:hypothetical protein
VRKTERVVQLTDAKLKRVLQDRARRAGVTVAELVRQRFERQPSREEAMLAALTAELNRQVDLVSRSADRTLALADDVLAELRAGRARREAVRRERDENGGGGPRRLPGSAPAAA